MHRPEEVPERTAKQHPVVANLVRFVSSGISNSNVQHPFRQPDAMLRDPLWTWRMEASCPRYLLAHLGDFWSWAYSCWMMWTWDACCIYSTSEGERRWPMEFSFVGEILQNECRGTLNLMEIKFNRMLYLRTDMSCTTCSGYMKTKTNVTWCYIQALP